MESLMRGALARGIKGRAAHRFLDAARNFSGFPVGNDVLVESQLLRGALTRGIRGLAAAHHAHLHARNFRSNNAYPKSRRSYLPPQKPPRFRIYDKSDHIDPKFFEDGYVINNADSESQFFTLLAKDRKVSILGKKWRLSFNQVMGSKFKGIDLPPLKHRGSLSNPTEDEIAASASSLIKSVDILVEDEPESDIVPGAMYMIYTDPRFQAYTESVKLKVLSNVLDVIQHYPQADAEEVFHMRRYIKLSTAEDTKDRLSKEEIESRVVDVVKSYHGVPYRHKVTRKTHFRMDLHADYYQQNYIIAALQMEFKMNLPEDIHSCSETIDYIYYKQKQECLTKWQVESRVIDVVKSYHGVPKGREVTRDTHFHGGLFLNYNARKYLIAALQLEFKMKLPNNLYSCIDAIDYIYHNQDQRMSVEYRKLFYYRCPRDDEWIFLRMLESSDHILFLALF